MFECSIYYNNQIRFLLTEVDLEYPKKYSTYNIFIFPYMIFQVGSFLASDSIVETVHPCPFYFRNWTRKKIVWSVPRNWLLHFQMLPTAAIPADNCWHCTSSAWLFKALSGVSTPLTSGGWSSAKFSRIRYLRLLMSLLLLTITWPCCPSVCLQVRSQLSETRKDGKDIFDFNSSTKSFCRGTSGHPVKYLRIHMTFELFALVFINLLTKTLNRRSSYSSFL